MFDELLTLFRDLSELEISPEERIADLEIDSLILIDLRNTIELKYNVDLKINQLISMTVGEAIDLVIKEADTDNAAANTIITTSPDEEFPLNDLQKAYLIGRSSEYELGNVSTHVYVEFDREELDMERFSAALNKVVERQEMLRTIILSSGKQKVVPACEAHYNIPFRDFSGLDEKTKNAILENERRRMSHEVFDVDTWPFFAVQVMRISEKKYRIYVSIDMLIADACSLGIFFRDLDHFYNEKDEKLPEIEFHFRDYIANDTNLPDSEKYKDSDQYWDKKCALLAPSPDLPLAKKPSEVIYPKFLHSERVIPKTDYEKLKALVKEHELTMPTLLLTAYIDVLSAWSSEKRFSVNVTNLDRVKYHRSVNDIIGQFASFTILSSERSGEDFYAHAAEIQNELWQDLDHRYIGGTQILQKIRRYSGNMGGALMPIVFTCILQDTSQTNWLGDIVYSISQTSQIWLDNQTLERNGDLVLSWDHLSELFPEGMVEQMLDAYEARIYSLINDQKPVLIPDKLFEARHRANETDDAECLKLVNDILPESFEKNADRVCIVGDDRDLTYKEADSLISKIAYAVSSAGAEIAAVIMDKSWKQAVNAVGIVKAGAAYLPIDASLPASRIEYMLSDSKAGLVIVDDTALKKLEEYTDKYDIRLFDDIISGSGELSGYAQKAPDSPMYIIYTSGSTGRPSGVIVDHGGLGNAISYTNKRFSVGVNDAVIGMTPFHHDMSVYDIFGTLAAGAKLVVPSESARKDPAALSALMLKEQITIWNSVPALMEVFSEYISANQSKLPIYLRLAFLGGDRIAPDMCRELFRLIDGLTIVSVGGPTETTLWNICYPFTSLPDDAEFIPYGKPISNTRYYILDDELNEVPDHVTGNICSSGIGVAEGYCGDPEKTAEKFVTLPKTGERICISGDLGRYNSDGIIEICGRKDYQIKINGVRIELEEIEKAVSDIEGVRRCAVVCSADNKKCLIAFAEADERICSEEKILDSLKKRLPLYMIPARIVFLDKLPQNANFKIDRRKLSEYKSGEVQTKQKHSSSNAVKTDDIKMISDIVMEVLGLSELDPDSDISLLGGSSIELIRIVNKLEKIYGHRMALEDFFKNLTVRKLAAYFSEHSKLSQGISEEKQSGNELQELIDSYGVLFDRHSREMFKMSNNGLRRDLGDKPVIALEKPVMSEELHELFRKRRSYRNYDKKGVSLEAISGLLFNLSNYDDRFYPDFLYASGGGLYSVQVYLYAMKDGIERLEQGFYYYDRNAHELRVLHTGADIPEDIHWSSNQAIYADSSFSLYLVSDYDAVGPMYGNQGVHFVTIEAGLMSELLEIKAPEFGIGLCQIGNMDFERIKEYLELKPSHIFMHTIIGGYIDYSGDYESKQQTREYMNYKYNDGTEEKAKDMIQAVNVQTLKSLLEE